MHIRGQVLFGVLAVVSQVLGYQVQTPPLDTEWTYKVGTNPWPEYPRPLLRRPQWQNLNGIWKYRRANAFEARMAPINESFTNAADVLVPSCLESGLSGVQDINVTYAWLTREFTVPRDWALKGRRIMLNFEAVDYEATVFVNGRKAGFHRGGYWHFNFDVTDFVRPNGTNTLHVHIFDPTDGMGYNIPMGKQRVDPSHIFYRACSGIWQTVWMESVPQNYIQKLDISADADGKVKMQVATSGGNDKLSISVVGNEGVSIMSHEASSNTPIEFLVESPKLWSPESPNLYNLSIKLGDDEVTSYTGFRTVSVGEVDGILRPLINGKFFFHFGTLDQGYWPDGLHTPPSREAMVYDLEVLKSLGLNMVRKHIKVEPALFYQACDQMGLLVIQDMPALTDDGNRKPDAAQQAEFERQFEIMIDQHKSYPSIYTWVIYNEGWGQITQGYYPEFDLATRTKELDPTRLVDATSGWYDHGAGDFHDNHHYANPQCGTPFYSLNSSPHDPKRIAIQGEFGGIGHNVSAENLWKVTDAVNAINQTYELDADLEAYNYRGHILMSELREQIERYACSGAVWTQTTDVEGEVNGFLTYDRRILRLKVDQWKADIQALYDAAQGRTGESKAQKTLN
ncbi:Glycoside hydrolase family 2 immunoglobulin-like beta-sandwich [Apiospora aurea]|uniref:Glycoside hydrolase family 2 immunoglobulin-like beta-sandwich n=1 Tax=Apiospora aurea TaxID=335848 RepID=A0ABR1PY31_9PEZI